MRHRTVNPGRPRFARLAGERRSAVALELAAAGIPFFLLFLGVMEVGYDLYVQEALDDAVNSAARLVQTGQRTGPYSTSQFVTQAVCPTAGALLLCADIHVNVQPVPSTQDYYTLTPPGLSASSNSVCTGGPGQFMLLQAWYTGPSFLGGLLPSFSTSFGGSIYHITYAAAGFVNEKFVGGQPC